MRHKIEIAPNLAIAIDGERVIGSKPQGLFLTTEMIVSDEDLKRLADRCLEVLTDTPLTETMTLEEAILHCEEVSTCSKGNCAEEHRQLAEWLKELKAYRETYPYGVDRFNGSDTPQTDAEIPKNALRSDCTGCRFVGTYDTEFPCVNCIRKNKDYYTSETERSE